MAETKPKKEVKAVATKTPVKKTAEKKHSEKKELVITVYDLAGKASGTMPVSSVLFGHGENKALIAQYIRVYNQNQRQGNASSKLRGEVVGTTKKVYKQKGTGRARHGSKKANLFTGGGVTFGPKPRDFSRDMSKKQKRLALFVSLSMKMKKENVIALEAEALKMKPKTQELMGFIQTLKLDTKKVLFILPKVEKNGFVLSTRNIKNVEVMQADTINPYAVLSHASVIFVGDAVQSLETHFGKTHESN